MSAMGRGPRKRTRSWNTKLLCEALELGTRDAVADEGQTDVGPIVQQ